MRPDTWPLVKLINQKGYKQILEVGSWRGTTARGCVIYCPTIECFWCVDPLRRCFNVFPISTKTALPKRSAAKNEGKYVFMMAEIVGATDDDSLDAIYVNTVFRLRKENPKIYYLRTTSKSAAPAFEDNSLCVVYIDAIHLYENVLEDINLWWPKVKPGGVLCGDDFCETFPGVGVAVSEVFKDKYSLVKGFWSVTK